MVVWTAAQGPVELPLRSCDRQIVDAGETQPHEAEFIEFPVLVAVTAKPLARGVVRFIGKTHRDSVVRERPQLFDQAVVELTFSLALEKLTDLFPPSRKFGPVAPLRVLGIDLHHAGRVAAVAGIFGQTNLL